MAHLDYLSVSNQTVCIRDGVATLWLAPGIGGAIAAYRWQGENGSIDWMRPASPEALRIGDPGGMSCFPLVPYSNRIRGGSFAFYGRNVQLPTSPPEDPHFEHGHGWRSSWKITELHETSIELRFVHQASAWPWRYAAIQRFKLNNGVLEILMELQNLSETPMPAGLGMHPHFPTTPLTRLDAVVDRMWDVDGDVLPTELVPLRPDADPNAGLMVANVELDNVFTSWNRTVRFSWPELRRTLRMEAEAPLDFLVLYTPNSEPFFCAEPVSNVTDAFNMAAGGRDGSGMLALAPGSNLMTKIRFVPGFD